MNEQPRTIQEVEQLAAKWGITLTPDDYADAQAVMDQRQAQLSAQLAAGNEKRSWVDVFNHWYPRFLRLLHGVGDTSIMLAQTILVGPGVLLVLMMLLIVEQQRVFHGVSLFEIHEALSNFSAIALVILNLSLELLSSWVEHRANWQEPPRHEFSLRLLLQRFAYIVGQQSDWKARAKSPAYRFRAVLKIVTFTILALALAGSMRSVIERQSGNWIQAVGEVLSKSTLLEMATWIGGLLFAVAAVLSAQALSQYAARKAIEIGAILASNTDDKTAAILESVGATGAAALFARLKDRQRQRRVAASLAADMPDFSIGGRVSVPSVPALPVTQAKLPTKKMQQALDWIAQNPDSKLSMAEQAEQAGVSVRTMYRARNRA